MRKIFVGLALLGVLVTSSACEADTDAPSAATTTTTVAKVSAQRASTGSSTASECKAKFTQFAELSGQAGAIADQISSRSDAVAFLGLADTAVEVGRFLMDTCGSYAPAGFATQIETLADAADELRMAL